MKITDLKKEDWEIGDVYAYRIEGDYAREKNLTGRFFLIQKIGEEQLSPQIFAPIVYIKITRNEVLPKTCEEYNQLEYVQVDATKYEERYWPLDFSRIKEDIAEKSNIIYEVDEYGYLPQYRAKLVLAARKRRPPDIRFVGSFLNAEKPKKEFIPHASLNMSTFFWKKNGDSFEKNATELYVLHNLRTSKRYKQDGSRFETTGRQGTV